MSNEEHGEIDDHTGAGRRKETGECSQRVDEQGAEKPISADPQSDDEDDADEPHTDGSSSLTGLSGGKMDGNVKAVADVISLLFSSMGVSESWSGMLPRAQDYNAYDPETRERICRWNDAYTVVEITNEAHPVQVCNMRIAPSN